MNYDVTKQKKLWMYAIIMFACAFIVILATGYSQIKQKNSNAQANKRATVAQKRSASAEQNLNSANTKIDELKTQLENTESNNTAMSSQVDTYKKKIIAYTALIKAQTAFNNNNIINSALILKRECDSTLLEKDALSTFNKIKSATYGVAAESLYFNGYRQYSNNNFKAAISSFDKSLLIINDEYYSDDCYYFTAYSQHAVNKKESAIATLKDLIKKYPKSSFIPDAKSFLKSIEDE